MRSLLLGGACLLTACATRTPLACPQANPNRTARVMFATDRLQEDPAKRKGAARNLEFGPERTAPPTLQLGWQEVKIGPKHRLGLLDKAIQLAPATVEKANVQPSSPLRQNDADIVSFATTNIRQAIRSAPKPPSGSRRQVLLFVHGYNSTFNYAVTKTAQLASDLELVDCNGQMRGVAIAYSWPAQGTLLSYLADEENAEWSQQRLVPFLRTLAIVSQQEGADLHIIAHSMGGRLMVRSLSEVASTMPSTGRSPLFKQVILLAPDIGRELFNQYSERMLPVIGHLTVYVSSKDRALTLSSFLHGGHHRLGLIESTISTALRIGTFGALGGENYRELAGYADSGSGAGKIDMVDVSEGVADVLGHSYEDPAFIHDLHELMYHYTPAGTGGRSNLIAKKVRPGLFGFAGRRISYFELPTD